MLQTNRIYYIGYIGFIYLISRVMQKFFIDYKINVFEGKEIVSDVWSKRQRLCGEDGFNAT